MMGQNVEQKNVEQNLESRLAGLRQKIKRNGIDLGYAMELDELGEEADKAKYFLLGARCKRLAGMLYVRLGAEWDAQWSFEKGANLARLGGDRVQKALLKEKVAEIRIKLVDNCRPTTIVDAAYSCIYAGESYLDIMNLTRGFYFIHKGLKYFDMNGDVPRTSQICRILKRYWSMLEE